jgi:cobalamin biosynthesis Mg chelatase CobN
MSEGFIQTISLLLASREGRIILNNMSPTNRQKNSPIPADLQPYYDEQAATHPVATWLTRVLAIVITAVLIVLFVRWVWHQTHTTDKSKPTGTSQQATSGASKSTSPKSTPGSGNSSNAQPGSSSSTQASGTGSGSASSGTSQSANSSSTPATGSSPSTTSSASTPTASSDLNNTGPGQTIGIFVAASLFFALLYELRLRKQRA